MTIVIWLGPENKYLGYKKFNNFCEAEEYLDSMSSVIIANIESNLSLKERQKLAPEYFPFIGKIHDFEVISEEFK